MLRDQPAVVSQNLPADGTQGANTPGSKPFRLERPPIVRGSVQILVGGPPQTIFYDIPVVSGANQVTVNTDTGELIWGVAPPAGSIATTYLTARYGDQQILDALNEGL